MPDNPEAPIKTPAQSRPSKRQWRFLPITRLGKWAVWLAAATLFLPLLTWLVNLFINLRPGAETTGIAIPGALMAGVAVVSGILGLVALLRRNERGLLVWLPIFLGFFFFFLVVIDLLSAF